MSLRILLLASLVFGCSQPLPAPAAPSPTPPSPSPTPATQATKTPEPPPPSPPAGYVKMTVLGVASAGSNQQTVALVDADKTMMIPILIGGTEATTIAFRLHGQPFPRPLTHDLLDSVLQKFGGTVYKVQVDDLVDGTFIGSVFVVRNGNVIELDARPSDALALAIGHSVPIYVAQTVIDQTARPLHNDKSGNTP